jgi:fused signal recognition particle receptor
MTFDWFRRQFNQQAEEAQAEETQPAQSEPDRAESKPEPEEESPAVAEDYLNWAKAAYQNIQKRQQTETVEPLQETPPPAETETAPVEVDRQPEPIPDAAAIAEAEPAVAESEPTIAAEPDAPQSQPSVTAEPAIAAEAESIVAASVAPTNESPPQSEADQMVEQADSDASPLAQPEPATETAAPLPFWLAAEADRQARLERLRETAIAEPEPETPVVSPITAQSGASVAVEPTLDSGVIPDLALDEGFIWSAEVLAAQGRRPEDVSLEEITWLKRLRQGLDKTRRGLINQLRSIVGQGPLTQDAVLEIESVLLQADVGVDATDAIIESLQQKLRSEVLPPDAAITYLKQILRDMLDAPLKDGNVFFTPQKDTLNIWLITGVNGAGKTTTIGKLAHIAQKSDYRCLIAAADTFRAAAVEQVKIWGSRSGVEVIANPGQNTDPAAVVFDAIAAAQSRGTELLLVDTAGRLQNKKNLMDELSKIRRIIDKKAGKDVVVESLLVLDATLGQNGLRQAEVFSQAAQLSGVVLTKLDGTAKGGIALAIVQQLGLPIRFIGAGEGIEDLRPFSSYEFVEALLNG